MLAIWNTFSENATYVLCSCILDIYTLQGLLCNAMNLSNRVSKLAVKLENGINVQRRCYGWDLCRSEHKLHASSCPGSHISQWPVHLRVVLEERRPVLTLALLHPMTINLKCVLIKYLRKEQLYIEFIAQCCIWMLKGSMLQISFSYLIYFVHYLFQLF